MVCWLSHCWHTVPDTHDLKERLTLAHYFQRIQAVLDCLKAGTSWWKDLARESRSLHGIQEAEREKGGAGKGDVPARGMALVTLPSIYPLLPNSAFSQDSSWVNPPVNVAPHLWTHEAWWHSRSNLQWMIRYADRKAAAMEDESYTHGSLETGSATHHTCGHKPCRAMCGASGSFRKQGARKTYVSNLLLRFSWEGMGESK